jgi:hypothetical protein
MSGAAAREPLELEVALAAALPEQTAEQAWLVHQLWSRRAVGLISGQPKVGKTWFGLDLAISVASGTDCLGTFRVDDPGPVLIYLAEDALPSIRERIVALCAWRRLALASLPLYVITAPSLRLDDSSDRDRLTATVARLQPRLLVLDPLIRLHSGDENDARYVSALLGFLRTLSRRHLLAVALVHHLSKKSRRQLGQALRGSSDLWAWADSSAYLTRAQHNILLTLEHRSASAPEPLALRLALGADGATPHLERAGDAPAVDAPSAPTASPPPAVRLRQILREAQCPLSRLALRQQLRINNQRLGDLLTALERDGSIVRTTAGWSLPQARPSTTHVTEPPASADAQHRFSRRLSVTGA